MCMDKKIIDYVRQKPRTKKEICAHFNLSNTQSYHKLRYLVKWKDLDVIELTGQTSQVGRCFIYKARGEK